jgi:phosphate-selective porin
MRSRSNNRGVLTALMALGVSAILLAAPSLQAQTESKVQLHFFGDWVFGKTDGNSYQSANKGGRYDDTALGMLVHYDASEKIAVVGQVAWEASEGLAGDSETLLDYAFVQWTRDDRVHVRFGRTYHPFGIYSEIRDVGTARPFIERPPEVYGDLGIVSGSLQGISVYGDLQSPKNWSLHYDVYGGATDLPFVEVRPDGVEERVEKLTEVVGTTMSADTPIEGLSVGLSLMRGSEKKTGEEHRTEALSVDYSNGRWMVRAEATDHKEGNEKVRGGYIEAGFRPVEKWQLTGRYGRITGHTEEDLDGRFLRHRDVGAGLNYWIHPSIVIKNEVHFIDGNRLTEAEEGADLKKRSRVFQTGVQFSF